MNPTNKELQLRKNCLLYRYLLQALDKDVPEPIQECADADDYDFLVDCVDALSETLNALSDDTFHDLISKNNTPEAKELASWWHMHKVALQLRDDIRQTCL